MRYDVKIQKAECRIYVNLFCVGLVVGVFLLNVGKDFFLERTGLFDEYTLYQMKYMTIDSHQLFWYVFRKRMIGVLVLLVASTTYLGMVACRGVVLWYGCSAGIFLAALMARYGLKGILLAMVSILPQYILYAPAMLILLCWCESLFRNIYLRGGEGVTEDRKTAMARAGKVFLIIIAMAVGCLVESYVNPHLLLGFLETF